MPISSRARLRGELHCMSHDGRDVRTAQHWVDPDAPGGRPRGWLRLVVNGRPVQDKVFVGGAAQAELAEFWSSRALLFGPTGLSEDQMWQALAALTGIERSSCLSEDCSGILPVAWWYCPECGRDARRVAAGSMLWPSRRGIIVMDHRNVQDPA